VRFALDELMTGAWAGATAGSDGPLLSLWPCVDLFATAESDSPYGTKVRPEDSLALLRRNMFSTPFD
jgi:hypothetical protein